MIAAVTQGWSCPFPSLEQLERARARTRGVRVVKLAGEDRYLARSRAYEPGSYFELRVSPWGHVRCSCPGFSYRGICKHAEALKGKLNNRRQPAKRAIALGTPPPSPNS